MSYDLFLKPRQGVLDREQFAAWLQGRANWKVQLPQCVYGNEATGVSFGIDLQDGGAGESPADAYPIAVNINYFRPSFFALEIEPEIAALVARFDLLALDPQMHGMGEGEYSGEGLRAGWSRGNAFACRVILRDPRHTGRVDAMPAAALREAWRWNFHRRQLQDTYADDAFVPKVLLVSLDGRPVRAATWGDGIPLVVPQVEYFIVVRDALKPRGLFGLGNKEKDFVWVPWGDARDLLERHRRAGVADFLLDWKRTPKDVVDFVQALRPAPVETKRLSPDKVLDEELVALARAERPG